MVDSLAFVWSGAVFLSKYEHSLDDKGRVILPAKWRNALEGGAVVTEWPDGCLAVFPEADFLKLAEGVDELASGRDDAMMTLSLYSGAVDVMPDKQGRIPIPVELRSYAGLQSDVTLAGHRTFIQIWNPQTYMAKKGVGTEKLHTDGYALLRGRP